MSRKTLVGLLIGCAALCHQAHAADVPAGLSTAAQVGTTPVSPSVTDVTRRSLPAQAANVPAETSPYALLAAGLVAIGLLVLRRSRR